MAKKKRKKNHNSCCLRWVNRLVYDSYTDENENQEILSVWKTNVKSLLVN